MCGFNLQSECKPHETQNAAIHLPHSDTTIQILPTTSGNISAHTCNEMEKGELDSKTKKKS